MTVKWKGYEPFDPGFACPLRELPRREARKAFKVLMAAKSERIEQLRQLLANNGVELRESDEGLVELEAWFRREVRADPDQPDRLHPCWYAVVNDIALFLGDVIIDRAPGVRWVFYEWGAKNVSYQRHVLMGFSTSSNPKFNLDIDREVAALGYHVIYGTDQGEDVFASLVGMYVAWA